MAACIRFMIEKRVRKEYKVTATREHLPQYSDVLPTFELPKLVLSQKLNSGTEKFNSLTDVLLITQMFCWENCSIILWSN